MDYVEIVPSYHTRKERESMSPEQIKQLILEQFPKLDKSDRMLLMRTWMREGHLDPRMLLLEEFAYLQEKSEDQKRDIGILANAGLSLGESTIRRVSKLKNERKQHVIAGQARSLLSTGVFRDTPFEAELQESIKGIEIDKDWYEYSWKLKSITEEEKQDE